MNNMPRKKTKKDLLSIIVPCYNEQEALPIFYKELNKVLKKMNLDHEIILVDDGSKDETLKVMRELAKKDVHVRYLSFSRNFGKEAAMYAGFVNAKGDYALTMDADMQDPPSLLPKMYEIIKTGEYDSVATRRVDRKGESKVRSFFARAFYKIINRISDADIVDGARDFRLMDRKMLNAIISMCEYNRFSKGIFGWVGFKTYWLDFENVERVAGTTSWSFWGLTKYAIDGIINFSNVPLDIASYFGLFMTFIAFVMLIFIIVRKLLFGDPVAGWASTMCVIIFIGGIQLFCLGIMGQYLGKTYMETKKRQHYIIAESNDKDIK
ncbi:MAG: glycosyltransferase family 2 protein [Erysipelotrichaceae bacterium]|nr:glycosyltransferase family 2 protein [Erysipelotrichaceae bacterium]